MQKRKRSETWRDSKQVGNKGSFIQSVANNKRNSTIKHIFLPVCVFLQREDFVEFRDDRDDVQQALGDLSIANERACELKVEDGRTIVHPSHGTPTFRAGSGGTVRSGRTTFGNSAFLSEVHTASKNRVSWPMFLGRHLNGSSPLHV